ncbi:MAG: hypothetical protein R6V19_08530, partial [Armatimonadota bacterium]
LGIVLDNDEIVWFVPPSAKLSRGSEDWQQLSGRYIAEEGRTIKQVRFFCLNYRNGAPASFDTLSLQAAQVKTTAARVTILTPGTPEAMQRQEMLAEAAGSVCKDVAVSPRVPNADDAEVLILPEWQDSDRLLEDVKTFAYCGGKVLCGWLPDEGTGLALWYWLFDGVGDTMTTGRQNTAAGWPEKYSPSTEEIAGAVAALLSAEWSWPKAPEIEQSWPDAPDVSFDEHGVRVGGEYRLLFAAGAYRVTEDADFDSDMRHFADLGMNAAVLYLHESEPLERLLAALDAAHDQGIVCLLYLQGGRGTHHPGRPWRAEWIAKFSPAAQHPAFIAWLTGDDTHSRHRDMMLRTHEIIRHYDSRGLVTMTLLDLRRPQNFADDNWTQWTDAFDFPTTYVYTLQRGEDFQTHSSMEGGLIDLQRLGDHAAEKFPGLPHLQWVQAHMQQNMWKRLGLSVGERWLPTPSQQGLLVLHALAGGADGLLYFTHATLEADAGGVGRAMQLKILHHQLAPFAKILLTGRRQHLEVEGQGAATVFDTGSEALIILRRVHRCDQAQVNLGREPTVTIRLPETLRGRPIHRVEPLWVEDAGVIQAHHETYTMAGLGDWRLFALNDDAAEVQRWNEMLGSSAEQIREAFNTMLTDSYLKTRAVFAVLQRSGQVPDDGAQLFEQYPAPHTFCPPPSAPDRDALQMARGRRLQLGTAHRQALAAAERFWKERSNDPLPDAARTFYGLPHFYQQAGIDLGYEPGQMSDWISAQE